MALFGIFRTRSRASNLGNGIRSPQTSVNYLCLLAALESGWQVEKATMVRGHGRMGTGSHYSLKLRHPDRNLKSEMTVEKSSSATELLREHGIRVR
jgi:hypothetical protein